MSSSGQAIFQTLESRIGESVGGKAKSLMFLTKNGFSVPNTLVCPWQYHESYLTDPGGTLSKLQSAIIQELDPQKSYAVRSSANVEDASRQSFAGQFDSLLDVRGHEALLGAIQQVWDSAQNPYKQGYMDKVLPDVDDIKMAVIIQEMVNPIVSGVAFSKNPLTGFDEIIVEAVTGSGEALMQHGVSPHRWVYKWGDWLAKPDDDTNISNDMIAQVVQQTKTIAQAYGHPIDLEWVYDGEQVYWVQVREITSLHDLSFYSNRIAKEVLPGLIPPLVWSINVPLVNSAWIEILTELIGHNDIEPLSLSKSFYYRAYFNMGVMGDVFELLGMPRESLELIMGIEGGDEKPKFKPSLKTYRHLPRMLGFVVDKSRYDKRIQQHLQTTKGQYERFAERSFEDMSDDELLQSIDELYQLVQKTAYFNIITPLLMQIYNQLLQRQLKSADVDRSNFDLTAHAPELDLYDPNPTLLNLSQQYQQLNPDAKTILSEDGYAGLKSPTIPAQFRKNVELFIQAFGHLSDSGNDFSVKAWHEQPDLILSLIIDLQNTPESTQKKITRDELDISGLKRTIFDPIYHRARRYRINREAISSLYTYGYGIFRNIFLALAQSFVDKGIIGEQEDIFLLYIDEIRTIVNNPQDSKQYQEQIATRKQEMEQSKDIVLPETIIGDTVVPINTTAQKQLQGVPTSRGYYQGPARVVEGIQDFDKVQSGDVLVIPYSDVGWTPLFNKAGAVIAESGGILSHSSIVAREFNIPAVVSVPSACTLLRDTVVSVNGITGEISIVGGDS